MAAVVAYGTPQVKDPARIGTVTALGLDETLFVRSGPPGTQGWCISVVDSPVLPSCSTSWRPLTSAAGASAWLVARSPAWRAWSVGACWTWPGDRHEGRSNGPNQLKN